MTEIIYPLLEAAAIIVCLHGLYDKPLRLSARMAGLLAADAVLFLLINSYGVSRSWSLLGYLLIAVYMLLEFPCNLRGFLTGNMLYIGIVSILQLLAALLLLFIPTDPPDAVALCLNNGIVVWLTVLLRRCFHRIYLTFLKWNLLTAAIAGIYLAVLLRAILLHKDHMEMNQDTLLILVTFGIMLGIAIYYWQREREKALQMEMDAKIHKIYGHSYLELIDAIRKRQHEFNNHLQAILCMHYTIHTYSELIEAQLSYCNSIVDNNKFYRLLRGEWPVLSGFLYGKLQEADSKGIRIKYQYRVKKKNDRIPEFVFVEILGILLDNAVEAVEKIPDPVIRLYVEDGEKLKIVVSNPAEGLTAEKLSRMTRKGYSDKEGHTGLGLNKLEEYAGKYQFRKEISLVFYKQRNWLAVSLEI